MTQFIIGEERKSKRGARNTIQSSFAIREQVQDLIEHKIEVIASLGGDSGITSQKNSIPVLIILGNYLKPVTRKSMRKDGSSKGKPEMLSSTLSKIITDPDLKYLF